MGRRDYSNTRASMGIPQSPLQWAEQPHLVADERKETQIISNFFQFCHSPQLIPCQQCCPQDREAPATPGHCQPTGEATTNPEPPLLPSKSNLPCKFLGEGPLSHWPLASTGWSVHGWFHAVQQETRRGRVGMSRGGLSSDHMAT